MAVQIQLRRGTAAEWTSVNPILADGEIGYETDLKGKKIGNGVDTWTALSYDGGGGAVDSVNAKTGVVVLDADDISDTSTTNKYTTSSDISKLSGIDAGAEVNPDVVSQVDAEAGTATDERIWTAERVKQAIVALGGSGSVDDTAYGVSWDGVTAVAPSKNALYDFIESQVFKVDTTSNIIPVFWGGTQIEYNAAFPSGHPANYFVVITDGAVTPTNAADIVNVPSGNLVATDVQAALNEIQTEVDVNTAKVGYTEVLVSANTDVAANTAKVGYIAPTTETGVALDLSNAVGKYYNMASANSGEVYTFSGGIVGGWAQSLINTTLEPVVTGATKIAGADWVTATDMYLVVRDNGTATQFFFLAI